MNNPLYHQKQTPQPRKPAQPRVVTALKAGLNPASKTVQGLLNIQQKKGS